MLTRYPVGLTSVTVRRLSSDPTDTTRLPVGRTAIPGNTGGPRHLDDTGRGS